MHTLLRHAHRTALWDSFPSHKSLASFPGFGGVCDGLSSLRLPWRSENDRCNHHASSILWKIKKSLPLSASALRGAGFFARRAERRQIVRPSSTAGIPPWTESGPASGGVRQRRAARARVTPTCAGSYRSGPSSRCRQRRLVPLADRPYTVAAQAIEHPASWRTRVAVHDRYISKAPCAGVPEGHGLKPRGTTALSPCNAATPS